MLNESAWFLIAWMSRPDADRRQLAEQMIAALNSKFGMKVWCDSFAQYSKYKHRRKAIPSNPIENSLPPLINYFSKSVFNKRGQVNIWWTVTTSLFFGLCNRLLFLYIWRSFLMHSGHTVVNGTWTLKLALEEGNGLEPKLKQVQITQCANYGSHSNYDLTVFTKLFCRWFVL